MTVQGRSAVVVHEDGTGCEHAGVPHMAGTHGPALCPAGVRVTHVRTPEGMVPIAEAVFAAHKAANALTGVLTPLVCVATSYARSQVDRPALAALAAAAVAFDDAAMTERQGRDVEPAPGEGIDPCGNGPLTVSEPCTADGGELPGQVPLPF